MLHEGVDICRGRARATGNASASLAVDDRRLKTLGFGHGVDDGLVAIEDLLIQIAAHLIQSALAARKLGENALHAAHFLDSGHLLEHIIHGKAVTKHALGIFDLLGVGHLLRLLDNANDVTHAQDALGHAIGIERLERIGLLAHRDKLDGLTGNLAHGQGTAATGIAVELGNDDAVKVGALGKRGDHVDDVLTGHGVHNHQDLVGLDRTLDIDGLLHHLLVDLQATGGIDNDHVAHIVDSLANRTAGNLDRVFAITAEDRHTDLAAQGGELIGCSGTVHVARGEQRTTTLLLEQVGQFYSSSGLTGTLKTHEHDHIGNTA